MLQKLLAARMIIVFVVDDDIIEYD
jgi:hypothetical protein